MKHKLVVTPAIDIAHRHKIVDLLESLGYNVTATGQHVDDSECDISFEDTGDN